MPSFHDSCFIISTDSTVRRSIFRMIDTIFLAERSTYRVNLLVADHGWVYLDSGRAIVCPVLLGHIEIWQN